MRRTSVRYSLDDSLGSLSELDAQLEISQRLSYISEEQGSTIAELRTAVERLLSSLIRSLRQ